MIQFNRKYKTWTGSALASAGLNWKHFRGAHPVACVNILRGASSHNDRSQWCEKARPERV